MEGNVFNQGNAGARSLKFEDVVEEYYRSLYQFALSLTGSEADACDLTQHTFYTWGIKGGQLRDLSKVKAWLFTTLHNAFLHGRRKEARFPHYELSRLDSELPWVSPEEADQCDASSVLQALARMEELFRAPLALFYLEDCPYKEIARILGVPLGTVKSRIARGTAHLRKLLAIREDRDQQVAA